MKTRQDKWMKTCRGSFAFIYPLIQCKSVMKVDLLCQEISVKNEKLSWNFLPEAKTRFSQKKKKIFLKKLSTFYIVSGKLHAICKVDLHIAISMHEIWSVRKVNLLPSPLHLCNSQRINSVNFLTTNYQNKDKTLHIFFGFALINLTN